MFGSLKWLDFDLQGHRTLYFGLFCWKTKRSKFPIAKCQIFDFLKSTFFCFEMDTFLARTSKKHFDSDYLAGKKEKNVQIFDQKSGGKCKKAF